MRVVAGELGGRRLRTPRGEDVRPTTDRVREALFSIVGEVGGLEVLDLFCGTGALGIEALSRGAAAATLVDSDIGPATVNVEALDLDDRARLVRADAHSFLRREQGTYDLVLCDPPYSLARRLGPQLDSLLPPRLRHGARVITESAGTEPLALTHLPLLDERTYGATSIRIYGGER